MKFNCVISTNTRALQTWQGNGFAIVRRLPEGFHHPKLGYVCACDVP
jgi:hypothetical protein